MAMSFSARAEGDSELMLDINTTPLIDVMLVLIIMLIITIPVQLHQLQLGRAGPPQTEPAAQVVRVDLLADGRINWNGTELADRAALEEQLLRLAAAAPQPQLLLRPDSGVAYRHVAAVLAAARRLGVSKLGLAGHERLAP